MSVLHKVAVLPVSPLMGIADALGGSRNQKAVLKQLREKRKKRAADLKSAGSQGPSYR
jgi:hypothetical protein